jgi:hypothetical protein
VARCRGYTFQAVPDLVDDDPENERTRSATSRIARVRRGERAAGIVGARADGCAPGGDRPVTAEGKAAAAKNLEGHPTPQESRLTRFNAMKHGMEARTATYFPAKPGKYAFCEGCDVDTPGAPRSRRA